MKTTLTFLLTIFLTTVSFAQHHHSGHEKQSASELSLNEGKKWETDAPLRQAMENIQKAFQAQMKALHSDKMTEAEYKNLGQTFDKEIASIFKNCKLSPKADAALHVILVDLLKAKDVYLGKNKELKKMDATILIFNALEKYPQYFDHPAWQPLRHDI